MGAPNDAYGASSSSVAATAASFFPKDSVFVDGQPLPRLIVFDLDYTLWPFWVDTHVSGPLKAGRPVGTAAIDRFGESYGFYSDVPAVLRALWATDLRVGVASRTSAPDLARDMLRLLVVPGGGGTKVKKEGGEMQAIAAFDAGLEIYPTNKLRHMEALQKRTGIEYEDFLFFDDESRNRNVETLGVTMCLVRDGVSWREMERGVREWRRRRGHGGKEGNRR